MRITIKDKLYNETTIDTATATLAELNAAYTYLNRMADSGGAYPGSKAWREAKVYDNTLAAMIAERPEIEAYRRRLSAPVIDWDKANNI
ncbi:MAG TPA: hypothetical protein PLY73_11490 [Candidatus Ozemobacteraceae bacterium]|nr:hypothetical protein [Candidatus Ozemobacteraceae bacterium]